MACVLLTNDADPADREYSHQASWPLVSATPQHLPSGRWAVVLERRAVRPLELFHGEHPVTYVARFRLTLESACGRNGSSPAA